MSKKVYETVKSDLEAYKEGDREETFYCNDPPYYKGWKSVLDLTDKCVKEGGTYAVSNS